MLGTEFHTVVYRKNARRGCIPLRYQNQLKTVTMAPFKVRVPHVRGVQVQRSGFLKNSKPAKAIVFIIKLK